MTEAEHYTAKARVAKAKQYNNGAAQKDDWTKSKAATKPSNHAPKASVGSSPHRKVSVPAMNRSEKPLNEAPRKAGGGFRIPV